MIINMSYDICALILISVIFFVFLSKKKPGMLQNSMFYLFIVFAFGTTVFDMLCLYILKEKDGFSFFYEWLAGCGFMLFHNLMAFSFALYVMSIIEKKLTNISTILRCVLVLPIIASIVLSIAIFVSPSTLAFDNYMHSHNGIFQLFTCAVLVFYILFGVYVAHTNRELTDEKFRNAIYFYVAFIGGSNILQFFIPQIPIECFGTAVYLTLIFLTIQKPEEFLDTITGLFNKSSFARTFLIYLKTKRKYTTIIIYIEDMKMLVHALGMDKINTIRVSIANFLESTAPKSVYTLGTSTFAVILDYYDEEKIAEYVEKIDKGFEQRWKLKDNSGLFVTARILDIKVPDDIDTLELFYNYMDYLKGLDNSKKWVVSAKDISLKDTKRRVAVENAVKKAIENDSFMVYYQPIYSIEKNKIISAEALVRLNDDELGFISPAEFIPISEQNGAILKIGEIVFDKVCRFIKESNLQDKGIEYVEINLSVVQCMQENLAIDLLAIMKKYGVKNSRINLEITETAAAYSPKMLVRNMRYLFDNGVSFSLDDFGTGYSNINSLLSLPLDMIKFDKSMIDTATDCDKGKIVLGSSIAMVKRMNLKIVAEGVETLEQVEMFAAMGIDYLQGYFFSKPVCEEDFVKYIEGFKPIDSI